MLKTDLNWLHIQLLSFSYSLCDNYNYVVIVIVVIVIVVVVVVVVVYTYLHQVPEMWRSCRWLRCYGTPSTKYHYLGRRPVEGVIHDVHCISGVALPKEPTTTLVHEWWAQNGKETPKVHLFSPSILPLVSQTFAHSFTQSLTQSLNQSLNLYRFHVLFTSTVLRDGTTVWAIRPWPKVPRQRVSEGLRTMQYVV